MPRRKRSGCFKHFKRPIAKRAPLPPSELKARARVDEGAARGRPALAIGGGKLAINFRRKDALVPGDAMVAGIPPEAFIWLHRDAFISTLDREIDALGVTGGLSDTERRHASRSYAPPSSKRSGKKKA